MRNEEKKKFCLRLSMYILFLFLALDVSLDARNLEIDNSSLGHTVESGKCLEIDNVTSCYTTYNVGQTFDTGIPLIIYTFDAPKNFSQWNRAKNIFLVENGWKEGEIFNG